MAKQRQYFLLSVKRNREYGALLPLNEVAYRSGLHPELVERFIHLGLIDYAECDRDGTVLFEEDVIPLLHRIIRLRNHLGVNYAGIGVILELISRIEELERRVSELQERFGVK